MVTRIFQRKNVLWSNWISHALNDIPKVEVSKYFVFKSWSSTPWVSDGCFVMDFERLRTSKYVLSRGRTFCTFRIQICLCIPNVLLFVVYSKQTNFASPVFVVWTEQVCAEEPSSCITKTHPADLNTHFVATAVVRNCFARQINNSY